MNKKGLFIGVTSTLALLLVGCGSQKEAFDASKYVDSPKKLVEQFNKEYKGYQVSEIKVDNERNKAVYEIKGFNDSEEAEMQVDASKTSEVMKSHAETMDKEDKSENRAINLDQVQKKPEEVLKIAKKAAKSDENASEWELETTRHNQVIYNVHFEEKLSDKETNVRVNATTGEVLTVHNDD